MMTPHALTILLPLILLIALCTHASGQTDKPMTNQDVIKLVKLGPSPEIIIKKIKDSPPAHDLSIDGLTSIAQNRVLNEVIKAMQAAARQQGRSSSTAQKRDGTSTAGERGGNSGSRSAPCRLPPNNGAHRWDGSDIHLLYQSTVPSAESNFWRRMTPFVKKKFELQLVGAYANAHFQNQQPTILVSGLGEVIPGSPAYRLLYFKTGGMLKDRRIVGSPRDSWPQRSRFG